MPRIRTFKAELFTDEKLLQCSIEARYLFLGLFPHCDDMGRMQYSWASLKSKIFPLDDEISAMMVETLVKELDTVGVVELYEYRPTPGRSPQRWLRIPHFLRHQVINRPSHCTSPSAPSETDDLDKLCRCANPICVTARKDAEDARNGHHKRKRTFASLREDSQTTHGELTESLSTHGVLTEDSRGKGKEGKGVSTLHGESSRDIYIADATNENDSHRRVPESETTRENRRTQIVALTEIATNIFKIFSVEPKSDILKTLMDSIEVRARSKACSIEAAAQEISSRAAWIAGQAVPENWEDWFFDARYQYVPQGDSRLKDKRIEARPLCGGTRCTEGWETVRIGDQSVSRRCPDCAKLWRDAGL